MNTPWVPLLRSEVAAEFADRPWIGVLASVDASGAPRVRCVVVRAIDDKGRLAIVSDARSRKNAELRREPRAALAIWLAGRRAQFRLEGRVDVVEREDARRAAAWRSLSDASRAMFAWPQPGAAWTGEEGFVDAVPAGAAPPPTFELLRFSARSVERLLLSTRPHERVCWSIDDGWTARRVNP